jgi:hypothetical protein
MNTTTLKSVNQHQRQLKFSTPFFSIQSTFLFHFHKNKKKQSLKLLMKIIATQINIYIELNGMSKSKNM